MIISKTPLRISFVGGGSDFPEHYRSGFGTVVSTAIDKYIYIIVKKSFDDQIRVSYSKTEYSDHVDDVKHNIIREALKLVGIQNGVEIIYIGDIPPASVGTGLAASSAIAVGALNALHALKGERVSAEKLAQEACQIEIDILKQPIGKQDQYITAYGGLNKIRFNSDDTVFVDPILIKNEVRQALQRKLMLFHTGLVSDSKKVLTEQKQKTEKNSPTIGKMAELAEEMTHSLRNGEISKFGTFLHKNWELKKCLASKVTNKLIDGYYAMALGAGATGGKILGSGGGGFLLFYSDEKRQNKVRRALKDLREVPFRFESQGSRIMYTSEI